MILVIGKLINCIQIVHKLSKYEANPAQYNFFWLLSYLHNQIVNSKLCGQLAIAA